jgi:hypothetical protein
MVSARRTEVVLNISSKNGLLESRIRQRYMQCFVLLDQYSCPATTVDLILSE